MKLFLIVLFVTLCGCGSPESETPDARITTSEKDLGLYVGSQSARLVTDDGRLHDPVYNLFTTVIQEGVYLAYKPDPNYAIFGNASTNHNTPYRVYLRREYQYGKPRNKEGVVYIGIGGDRTTYGYYPCYIPGAYYY